ncbi:MAG: TonB-dependent receptor [Candidatus Pseudobacter hemicellulosilyticus]|uniref:TonB-dependent receptor n=1 Tax=Candidatus Pseudobacter hemicellulosilyticus TaxID=3121375 RepID=A0AAJ5WSD9_9BACT|nr:MAG: TonB-dependent receptor [Pseudobacter sp.]
MKQLVLSSGFLILLLTGTAQTPATDTAHVLDAVVVQAYEQQRQLKEVGAAINYIGPEQLARFNTTSILPALNATPGVHMEERSPGSFRLNLRGSTLRSPFGVRNVKVYWNQLPFTDPGGNTYLNQLSYFNIHSLEVIKGPASSLYGAGTGGAVLISSQPDNWQAGATLGYTRGSFNMGNLQFQLNLGTDAQRHSIGYNRLSSDGYREHTNMRRDVATWETRFQLNERQQLQTAVLYGDLYYQTPGGLTQAEYQANHRGARPAAGGFPSAETAQAAIRQQTFLAGITHQYQFSSQFRNTSTVYGAFSQVKNPTFRNYEKRMEPHFGGRTVFNYALDLGSSQIKLSFGGEAQRGFFNTKTFQNNQGRRDALQTDDEIDNWLYSAFLQGDLQVPGGWTLSAGLSLNQSSVTINRVSIPSFDPQKRTYSGEWAPRVALSKKLQPGLLVYASLSRGFSPPTLQEILPSTMVISTDLEAEHGLNYEVGVKSSWLNNRLYIEVNAFYFQLKQAIVQRRDASNADYFVNAGATRQRGLESQASYQLLPRQQGWLTAARIWASHTWSHFRYQDFKQLSNDFSGNQLPSVAPHTVAAGLDLDTRPGLYAHLTWTYSDPIALNDANTVTASSYQLAGGRIGWKRALAKDIGLDLFLGMDNLFDAAYSLGNDINAAGGRYYNPAAGANWFGGLTLRHNW